MFRCALFVRVATLTALAVACAAPASAQTNGEAGDGRVGWMLELAVTAETPFVEDGNGVMTRAAIGPSIAGGVSVRLRERVSLIGGLRIANSALRAESNDDAWQAGRVGEYAGSLGVEVQPIPSIAFGASLLGARLTGPSDVIPFRGGAITTWGTDVAAYLRRWRTPVDLVVAASFFHLADQPEETLPLDGGWVGQIRLGARHVFR